ncbi:orotidine-5'-phosphate decarboxylase [Geomicrobium halophilum]|uniref:Orotidine 5'-phosphate decarboxylase n=1 Tax=Geomicrobium halophilum TaxID=549000 RepID=A0A841PKT9_9BACL|nr:orotidine-5'-phosphate decarboxylase [Geomicrobium halophilum]MBB6449359.1 orotidine-5'-phosphate decarboxylase [Geomicrobium halophilum]
MKSLFIALDMETKEEALAFLNRFNERRPSVKVGMELFYSSGPAIIQQLKARGHDVFLDLKCHDIPKTVERTMHKLASFDVDLVTLHAAGGKTMMEAAKAGLDKGTPLGSIPPKCVAVTVLTSTTQAQLGKEMLIERPLENTVFHFTDMSLRSGLDGVVCSVQEVEQLRKEFKEDVFTVTPGIRPRGTSHHDQKRAATPAKARAAGVDAIVVGRAITTSNDPLKAYERIHQEWVGAGI